MRETIGGWSTIRLRITTQDGDKEVDGLVHRNAPGLAVIHRAFGYFGVTHVPSGRNVGSRLERCGAAMYDLAVLSRLADWTKDGDGVLAEIEAVGDQTAPVAGFTAISRGVSRPMTVREVVNMVRSGRDEFPFESPDDNPAVMADRILLGTDDR